MFERQPEALGELAFIYFRRFSCIAAAGQAKVCARTKFALVLFRALRQDAANAGEFCEKIWFNN